MTAQFNETDHATTAGWATYHHARSLRCRMFGHKLPPMPSVADGTRPDNYARCARCRAWLKCFCVGQHRYGGLDASSTGNPQ